MSLHWATRIRWLVSLKVGTMPWRSKHGSPLPRESCAVPWQQLFFQPQNFEISWKPTWCRSRDQKFFWVPKRNGPWTFLPWLSQIPSWRSHHLLQWQEVWKSSFITDDGQFRIHNGFHCHGVHPLQDVLWSVGKGWPVSGWMIQRKLLVVWHQEKKKHRNLHLAPLWFRWQFLGLCFKQMLCEAWWPDACRASFLQRRVLLGALLAKHHNCLRGYAFSLENPRCKLPAVVDGSKVLSSRCQRCCCYPPAREMPKSCLISLGVRLH